MLCVLYVRPCVLACLSRRLRRGIIPRAMQYIFRHVEQSARKCKFTVKVSYLELYNEKVFDLLRFDDGTKSRSGPGLDIWHHKVRLAGRLGRCCFPPPPAHRLLPLSRLIDTAQGRGSSRRDGGASRG